MESGNLTDPTAVVDLADRVRFLCKYTLQESAVINRVVFFAFGVRFRFSGLCWGRPARQIWVNRYRSSVGQRLLDVRFAPKLVSKSEH